MVIVIYHNPDYICFYKEDKFPDNALNYKRIDTSQIILLTVIIQI